MLVWVRVAGHCLYRRAGRFGCVSEARPAGMVQHTLQRLAVFRIGALQPGAEAGGEISENFEGISSGRVARRRLVGVIRAEGKGIDVVLSEAGVGRNHRLTSREGECSDYIAICESG